MIEIIHNHGVMSQLYLEFSLPAVGDADAPLDRERVPLVAAGARLRPLALGARVRAVPALPPGVRIGPLLKLLDLDSGMLKVGANLYILMTSIDCFIRSTKQQNDNTMRFGK